MKMRYSIAAMLALALAGQPMPAIADPIGPGDFIAPTLIDFEDAPTAPIGTFYAGLGVTFSHLCGGFSFDTGTGGGVSGTGANLLGAGLCEGPNGADLFPDAEATFSTPMQRAGFYISTFELDDTFVSAYLGSERVGTEFFETGGAETNTGSFVGVEFLTGFDRIVINTTGPANGPLPGGFAIDDFRFEGDTAREPEPVPEPGSLLLVLMGGLSLFANVRHRGKQNL